MNQSVDDFLPVPIVRSRSKTATSRKHRKLSSTTGQRVVAALKAGRTKPNEAFTFYEFFAGGGMVRAGLGPDWHCLFANDFDAKKSATYLRNWTNSVLATKDVREVALKELPGFADLAWASFPCQDLSLAGMGAGLKGDRSGTFWPFWDLVKALGAAKRAPRVIVLENVCGTLTSHDGKDFVAIADALAESGYRFGALVMDAVDFVPHSRQRLFIIGIAQDVEVPSNLISPSATLAWHSKRLRLAQSKLTGKARDQWLWWNLPKPPRRKAMLADLIEESPSGVRWHSAAETARLIGMMSRVNREKVTAAQRTGKKFVGTVYKRTRVDSDGRKAQRAEIRFDGVAGCLRTSSGGSSRQLILVVKGRTLRSRLLSSREAARLMGLADSYKLPDNYNEAYHLAGDGVVVPVVRHLAAHILEPLLVINQERCQAAA